MSQYKVGDVAALFSKPKEPTTESGKKLQSLFNEFHSKNKKFSYQITEKEADNFNQRNENAQSQRVSKDRKKRKFSAVSSAESEEIVNSSKKFKNVKIDDANSSKQKGKRFVVEQDFPRKKSFKPKQNKSNNSFNLFEADETALSDDNEQASDVYFKLKNKDNDNKQVSNFIKKSKQQRQAARTIKSRDNEMSDEDASINATFFKEDNGKFAKQNSKKQMKKKFKNENFVQNKQFNHSDRDNSVENETLLKKSHGHNNKKNSQPNVSNKRKPDFIKVSNSKCEDDDDEDKLRDELRQILHKNNFNSNSFNSFEADETALSDDNFKSKNKPNDIKQVSNFIRKSKQQRQATTNRTVKSKDNEIMSDEHASVNDTLFKEGNEKFVKQNASKQMKKKFYNDNFVQNKHNSQPNISEKGEPDFIKIPDLKSEVEGDRLSRTLFVGNLPVNINRKALRTLFSPFGEIEDIRYHGIETDKAKIFNENVSQKLNANNYAADSVPGFIVFSDRQSAVKALSLSGSIFKGRHITVDFALPAGTKKMYDNKRSIFIGNLPFDCHDESVWEAFTECGRIENVRVVRDKKTGIGKGFGYVQFSTVQSKENALALEGLMIQERSIRIKPVDSNQSKQKKTKNPPPVRSDTFKSRAIQIKMKNKDSGSRKSVKKIMKKQKDLHKKKKMASILQKSMKM